MPTAYHTNNVNTLDDFQLWPAFWLMGSEFWKQGAESAVWPSCSEIDVLEWVPIKGIDKYSNAIHWDTAVERVTDPANAQPFMSGATVDRVNLKNEFHKYKTIISRDKNDKVEIKMFFDGIPTNHYHINEDDSGKQKEFYTSPTSDDFKYYGLLMNMALGGGYGGQERVGSLQNWPNNTNDAPANSSNLKEAVLQLNL
jgi:hypothetical protein